MLPSELSSFRINAAVQAALNIPRWIGSSSFFDSRLGRRGAVAVAFFCSAERVDHAAS
jgi:hypothetical protein